MRKNTHLFHTCTTITFITGLCLILLGFFDGIACHSQEPNPNAVFDLNSDRYIDSNDLLLWLFYRQGNNLAGDFNPDGKVDSLDLYQLAANWQIYLDAAALPPDPQTVAPVLNSTAPTDFYSGIQFLYSSEQPVQSGVKTGVIEEKRAAVLRGKVTNHKAEPLPGVTLRINNSPEYGQTTSRTDGAFDLAVNGGGQIELVFEKEGYLSVHRAITVPWRDFVIIENVVMTPLDDKASIINLSQTETMQVAESSVVTDQDGSRKATLLFPAGTEATMVLPDGSTKKLAEITVRATEYTTGSNGPKAMPAELPPNSGYTYCVEFSVDEAIAAGAEDVKFNKPLYSYVDNFLNFPIGGIVPSGYYDRRQSVWVSSKNGRVIKFLSKNADGLAELDVDGSGNPAAANTLFALGITDAELQKIAELYTPGKSYWRVPITHFTPWDYNWPYAPPKDAEPPKTPPPAKEEPKEEKCEEQGSIIEVQNQILGEKLNLTGTPFSMYYSSGRVSGHKTDMTINIPLSRDTIPASVLRIVLQCAVEGRRFEYEFSPATNLSYQFTWDGKDAYGRTLQGSHPITIRVGFVYKGVYMEPAPFEKSFANFSDTPMEGNQTRQEITLWKDWTGSIGAWDALGLGLGGWSLNIHHTYDPFSQKLYLGNGNIHAVDSLDQVITKFAGRGEFDASSYEDILKFWSDNIPAITAQLVNPIGLAVGPDGSVYFSDMLNSRIRKITPDGIVNTVAGISLFSPNPNTEDLGDGGLAVNAQLAYPVGITFAPDGTMFIADMLNNRIRKVTTDGIITTVAGIDESLIPIFYPYGDIGDGGLAIDACLLFPSGVALGVDGSLYIADTLQNRIRKVDTAGIISTIAGGSDNPSSEEGIPAIQAELNEPSGIAVSKDGSILFTDKSDHRIRKITPDGKIWTFAGTGNSGYSGDGGPAQQAELDSPQGITIGPDGTVYVADEGNDRIRRITPDGIITTIAGNGTSGKSGDGGPASKAQLNEPQGVAIDQMGRLYIADTGNSVLRRIAPALPGTSLNQIIIPARCGDEMYFFDTTGRHLETRNAFTGNILYQFTYNSSGQLSEIKDGNGNRTSIERDSINKTIAIIGPYGHGTVMDLNTEGYATGITNPDGKKYMQEYSPDGLLKSITDPANHVSRFDYDDSGRLLKDTDPAGGVVALQRNDTPDKVEVKLSTALSAQETYSIETQKTGELLSSVVDAVGARTEWKRLPGGIHEFALPDGVSLKQTAAPDPRFGMQSPYLDYTTITTPGGLISSISSTVIIQLATPDDPMSVVTYTRKTVPNGRLYSTVYQTATNQLTEKSPEGRQSLSVFDPLGRPVEIREDASLDPLKLVYDTKGRLAQVSKGLDSGKFEYDTKGRKSVFTDALNNAYRYAYNEMDQLTKVTYPSKKVYQFERDEADNLTSVTMPSASVYKIGYTAVHLEDSITTPDGSVFRKQYDQDKHLTGFTLPEGRQINYALDAAGRILKVDYPEAAIQYTYPDATNRPQTLSRDPKGYGNAETLSFTYDGSLQTQATWTGITNAVFKYRYDNNFALTGITLDSEPERTIAYDQDGLIIRDGTFAIERKGPAGAASRIADDKVVIDITYDKSGRISRRSHTTKGQVLYDVQLTNDANGRISEKTEKIKTETHRYTYRYDVDGQLVEVKQDGSVFEEFGYDLNANLIRRKNTSGTNETAKYDTQDRLLNRGNIPYQITPDGFLKTRASNQLVYSASGELLQINLNNTKIITYSYDALSRRVARSDSNNIIQYLYGNPSQPYLLTHTRDEKGVLYAYYYDDNQNLYAFEKGGVRYYAATDPVGTPKVVWDASGNIIKKLENDSYGKFLADSNPAFILPVGFAGGLLDSDTGFVHFAFRDYEPVSGRWTTADPLWFNGNSLNLYAYVDNDPINLRDPYGLEGASYDTPHLNFPRGAEEYKKATDIGGKEGHKGVLDYCKPLKDAWEKVTGAMEGKEGTSNPEPSGSKPKGKWTPPMYPNK